MWVRALIALVVVAAAATIVPYIVDLIRCAPVVSGDLYAAYLPPILKLLDGQGISSWENLFHGTGRVPGYPFALYAIHGLLRPHVELINAPVALNVACIVGLATALFALGRAAGQRVGAPNLAGALAVAALPTTRAFIEAVFNATPDLLFALLTLLFSIALIKALRGQSAMFLAAGVLYGFVSMVRLNGFGLGVSVIVSIFAATRLRFRDRLLWFVATAVVALSTLSLWTIVSWPIKKRWFWMENQKSAVGLHPDLLLPGEDLALGALLQKYPAKGLALVIKRGMWTGPIEVLNHAFTTWTAVLLAIALAVLLFGALRKPHSPAPVDASVAIVLLSTVLSVWMFTAPVHFEARYYLPIFILLTPILVVCLLQLCAWIGAPSGLMGVLLLHLSGMYYFSASGDADRQNQRWNQASYQADERFIATAHSMVGRRFLTASMLYGPFFFTPARYLVRREGLLMSNWEYWPPERHALFFDLLRDDQSSRIDPTAALDRMWPFLVGSVEGYEATRTPEEEASLGPFRRAAFITNKPLLVPAVADPPALGDGSMLTYAEGDAARVRLMRPALLNRVLVAPGWSSAVPEISALSLDGIPIEWTRASSSERRTANPVLLSFEARFATEIEIRLAEQGRVSELRGIYDPGPGQNLDREPNLERLPAVTSSAGIAAIDIAKEAPYVLRAGFVEPTGKASFKQLRLEGPNGVRLFSIPDDSAIGIATATLAAGRHQLSARAFDSEREISAEITSVDVFRVKEP